MYSIIDALFSRARTVILTFFAIAFLGGYSYIAIPKAHSPDIKIPVIYVSLHMDGISPSDSEKMLIIPMENSLRSLAGVKSMKSSAYEGGGNIILEFDAGFDPDNAYGDVKEKVDSAKSKLPKNADDPTISEVSTSNEPVISVVLSGDLTNAQLVGIAETLKDALEGRQEILSADIQGSRDDVLEITINPSLLESYNLDPTTIAATFKNYNQLIAAGIQENSTGRFSIKVPGLITNGEDVLNMPIITDGNAQIRIRDIATIRPTFKDRSSYARFNGKESVVLEVVKRTGENIVSSTAIVRAVTEEMRKSLPSELKVNYVNDRSEGVKTSLIDLQNSIIVSVILVMIIIVLAIGIRNGIMVGLSIPGAFLLTFLNLYTFGYTVNVVVLFALILSVGMLVDATVVVIEYADRCRQSGMRAIDSYLTAIKTMLWPLISSNATTLAAFIPLLFFPGIPGEFMRFLPLTLIITLSASLLMALVFIPILALYFTTVVRMLTTALAFALPYSIINNILTKMGMGTVAVLSAILLGGLMAFIYRQKFINKLFPYEKDERASNNNIIPDVVEEVHDDLPSDLNEISGFQGKYIRFLDRVVNKPRRVVLTITAVIGASVALFIATSNGVEFFPSSEPTRLTVNIRGEGNMSVYEKDAIVRKVEKRVMQLAAEKHDIKNLYTVSGHVGGKTGDKIGYIRIDLKEWDARRKAKKIQEDIQAFSSDFPGVYVEAFIQKDGPGGGGKPVQIEIKSQSREKAKDAARILMAHLTNNTKSGVIDVTSDVNSPGIDWRLELDRQEASKYNINVATLGTFLKFATTGVKLDSYVPDSGTDEIDIVARFPSDYRTLEQIGNLRISSKDGGIPISNFISREPVAKTSIISRSQSIPYYSIKADVSQGESSSNATMIISKELETLKLPDGVTIDFQGQNREENEAEEFLSKAFFIAVGVMFIILLIQFNSFFQTGLILSTVVMSFGGIFWGLALLQAPFGILLTGIGIVALAGIVVNNNIILLDTYNKLKTQTNDHHRAVLVTCAQRLRPVLLTTVTTVLGLMPMALGVNFDFAGRAIEIDPPSIQWWKQMSVTIASGLTFSTVLTLVMTPTLLTWWHKRQIRK